MMMIGDSQTDLLIHWFEKERKSYAAEMTKFLTTTTDNRMFNLFFSSHHSCARGSDTKAVHWAPAAAVVVCAGPPEFPTDPESARYAQNRSLATGGSKWHSATQRGQTTSTASATPWCLGKTTGGAMTGCVPNGTIVT